MKISSDSFSLAMDRSSNLFLDVQMSFVSGFRASLTIIENRATADFTKKCVKGDPRLVNPPTSEGAFAMTKEYAFAAFAIIKASHPEVSELTIKNNDELYTIALEIKQN